MCRERLAALLMICCVLTLFSGCRRDAHGDYLILASGHGATIPISNREEAIKGYLADRNLAPVEGIWVTIDNQYEVMITENRFDLYPKYDLIGFVADTQQTWWRPGEVKLLLKETASSKFFTGVYFSRRRTEYGTSFVLTGPNVLEINPSTGPYERREKVLLVRVYPKEGSIPRSAGTGFFVSADIVATNYHVVHGANIIIVHVGSKKAKAELLWQDTQNDLALLRVSRSEGDTVMEKGRTGTRCLPLGNSASVRAGDKVAVMGFPLGNVLSTSVSVSEGIVNNVAGPGNDPRLFQISVPIQPGSSGSPLFDSTGRVVGVVTSTLNNRFLFETFGVIPQNVNFAIKSSYLQSLLDLVPESQCESQEIGGINQLSATELQELLGPLVVRIETNQ